MIVGTIAGVIADSDAPTRHRAASTAPWEIASDAASRGLLPPVLGGDFSFFQPLRSPAASAMTGARSERN